MAQNYNASFDSGLERVLNRLKTTIVRDNLIIETTSRLRETLDVDRVVLYYFYSQWDGQVTFECLSSQELSILGSTGPNECFNDEYAALYLDGRIRAISDIESEPIADCHRDFLRNLDVRANLVVPILTENGLWGLLIAHHCQAPRLWTPSDIKMMQAEAKNLSKADSIRNS
ncbi:GAF domain-containing protein [Rivularia sp. UHCC 0363]|uniref:GAF domain-containing protein n=1 Tax=Rivularia sp. UHCC 0363 TaxID=3110244 RepID=UPI002B2013CD|nr:GAF domain-containing protein [Rivularia sp. UHCC 0363]MEA5595395.1 GAF domain-containing protein [Rivularia sp. UHCC 0363]